MVAVIGQKVVKYIKGDNTFPMNVFTRYERSVQTIV